MINPFSKKVTGDFVVIDSTFPQSNPFGFRNIEINEYLKNIKTAEAYSMSPMVSGSPFNQHTV